MQNIKLIAVASALIASLALTGCDKAKEAQAEPAAQTQEAPATANAPAPVAVEIPAPAEAQATTDATQSKADVTAPAAEPQGGKTPDQLAAHPAQPESPANTQPADAAKTK